MFRAPGFKVESTDDFKKIPDALQWEGLRPSKYPISNWEEMQTAAAKEWISRQLGFSE